MGEGEHSKKCFTVEHRFFEPPGETAFGSKNREFQKFDLQIVPKQIHGKELLVRRIEGSNRDSTIFSKYRAFQR